MLKRISIYMTLFGLLGGMPKPAHALGSDVFDFFEEERQVISASLRPQRVELAPATVYVVTADDIQSSGSQTLWDALRWTPGVDVMSTRTMQGEVSIRGLNEPFSNRTLVLLDGKTIMNAYFDFMTWEEVPVTMEEIDRIEIVEGPVSALYGANAVTGVINIITKKPEQLDGGVVRYSGGERKTHFGTALYGRKIKRTGYKFGIGWRSTHRFENADLSASKVGKIHALFSHELSEKSEIIASFGGANIDTQISGGSNGTIMGDGPSYFSRVDFLHNNTRVRAFWNRWRIFGRDFSALNNPNLDSDAYDVQVEHSLSLPGGHYLVMGGSYRRNTLESRMFPPGEISQDLWALFFENEWRPADLWAVVVSGRLDRHPLTPMMFSPRGSVIFSPGQNQTVRFSIGSAFKNPTLLDSYLQLPNRSPINNPPYTTLDTLITGNKEMAPERIVLYELVHHGKWGRVKTKAAGFHYKLKNLIELSPFQVTAPSVPPVLNMRATFSDAYGVVSAWGSEFGADARLFRNVSVFANASYQNLSVDNDVSGRDMSRESPKWKVNAGLRGKTDRLTFSVMVHWVDETYGELSPSATPTQYIRVDDYAIMNVYASYRFKGSWEGWEAGLSGYNVANHKHYQILPSQGLYVGEAGEIMRARWVGTVSYKF